MKIHNIMTPKTSLIWKWITIGVIVILAALDVIFCGTKLVRWFNCLFTVVAWLIACVVICFSWDFEIGIKDDGPNTEDNG